MKKKIAYILSRFPTVSETFILYEIIELSKLGLEIDIFPLIHQRGTVIHSEVEALAPRVHYFNYFSPSLMRDHYFWLRKKPGVYLRTLLRVFRTNLRSPKFLVRAMLVLLQSAQRARKIEELGVEHIHAHTATHPALMAYVVSSLTGIPYSFTAHSSDIYFNQTMLGEKIQHAGFVATISQYNQSFLQGLYPNIPAGKIKVVHCGIDPAKFQPATRRTSNPFNIICVGRLEKVKGHKYLIEACARLKAHDVDFRCNLAGDGELRSQLQQQIKRLDLVQQVKILGFQPHQQVVELLAQADVLVQPSISEGIPVAVMEGMAAGIPVVATAVTGVPELVEDGVTGLLVPSQDSMELAKAMLQLYKYPELRKLLGHSGRVKVIEEFNLQQSAALLFDLFQEVAPGYG